MKMLQNLIDLTASNYYVIKPCQLRVEKGKDDVFSVSVYNTITKLNDEIWILTYEEMETIYYAVEKSKFMTSYHSKLNWKKALEVAQWLKGRD